MLTANKQCCFGVCSSAWLAVLSLAAALCVALGACSGNGVGLDAGGQPLNGAGDGGNVPLSADFDSIQANVFTPICSVCHSGATAPEGLMLDAQHSYSLLVNVPSTEVPSVLRVNPGNPASSYIIQKLEGHAAVGNQMPLGQPPLPSSTINFIAQWITDGAPPGQAAAAAASFTVAAVAPLDAATLDEAPRQLALTFTRELDATHLDAQSARLERLVGGSDTAEGSAAATGTVAVPIELRIPAGNGTTLLLIPRQALPSGDYQIVLSAEPGAELAALDGARLAHAAGPGTDAIVARFSVKVRP
jgi:hypothetical protein